MATRCIPLGPLFSGEGSRAFLGLRITDGEASPCALVWVPEDVTCEPDLVERLRNETSDAAKLTHPNILRVFGLTEVDEGLARVVEYADGESLRRVLEVTKRLPGGLAARIAVDAALGVQYAHLGGNEDGTALVHGDLRPETLLVSYAGVTKVSGYGALTVAPKETGGKRVMGRRRHSAPEQILGGRYAVTPQTDVYLLGLVLYEALTGEVPFQGEKDFDAAVVTKQPPLLNSELVPARLRPVIGKALAKKGSLRFPTVQAFREAVEEAMGRLPDRFDLGAALEAAFASDNARRARQRVLEDGIQEWVVRKGLGRAAQPAAPKPAPTAPSGSSFTPAPPRPRAPPVEAAPPLLVDEAFEAVEEVLELPPAVHRPPLEVKVPERRSCSQPPTPAAVPQEERAAAHATAPRTVRRRLSPWVVAIPALTVAVAVAFWMGRRSGPEKLAPPLAAVPSAAAPQGEDLGSTRASAGPAASARVAESPRSRQIDPAPLPRPKPTLEVVTSPPLTVSVDGKVAGRTPSRLDLAPGPHRVTLSDPSQGIRIVRNVHVKPGMNRLALTVGKGTVTVSGPSGCEVRIDSRVVGRTPLDGPVPVFEGSHRIQVTLGDAHWQESFSLVDGEQVTVDVTFQAAGRG
jgi:serine/threonine-protein kinase